MAAQATVITPREDPWEMALRQFNRAADFLPLKRGIREFLAYPKRELTVNFPVKMDDGSVRVFTGYRVHGQVLARAQEKRTTMRTGALIQAVERVADALLTRGIYP